MVRPVAYFCLGSAWPANRRSAASRASRACCSAASRISTWSFSSAVSSTSGSAASSIRMKCMNSSMLTPPEQSASSRRHRPCNASRLTSCGFRLRPPCEPFARMTRSNSSNSRRSFSSVSMARKTLYQLKWPWYHFFAATLIVRMRFPRSSSIKGAQPSRINKYRPCWNSAMVTSPLRSWSTYAQSAWRSVSFMSGSSSSSRTALTNSTKSRRPLKSLSRRLKSNSQFLFIEPFVSQAAQTFII
mmetsp:Transcript_17474/g.49912  ORF Transcript_17474/g.49912 Transcript_17474/m.49912 type:complete len:244 (-) Transcript_17474:392-1123(-)